MMRTSILRKIVHNTLLQMCALWLWYAMPVYAAVIFQDNFDKVISGSNTDGIVPAGWSQWYREGAPSETRDGISHYAGEVSFPGRGGLGKSLKLWRHSDAWETYTGALHYYFPNTTRYNDIYIRWYMKLPKEMDLTGNSYYLKLFRLNMSGGRGEIYLNINNPSGTGAMRANGKVQVLSAVWQTVLDNAELRRVWDGNWHCWELRFGINLSRLTLWIDGIQKYDSKSFSYGAPDAGWFTMLQHFPLGNHSAGSKWQSSWQALEVDDFVLADTYIGPQ